MFITSLITVFLTIFRALRASPLYSGILTLGNGFNLGTWFNGAAVLPLLDNKAAHFTSPMSYLPLSLPAPPVVLSLPPSAELIMLSAEGLDDPGLLSGLLSVLVFLVLGYMTIYLPISCAIWLLRTFSSIVFGKSTKPDKPKRKKAPVIYISATPYSGKKFRAGGELAGVLLTSSTSPAHPAIPSTPLVVNPKPSNKAVIPASAPAPSPSPAPQTQPSPIPTSASPCPAVVTPPAPAASVFTVQLTALAKSADTTPHVAATSDTAAEEDGAPWQTWTNQRPRPPRPPPSPAAPFRRSRSSRSSSVFSTSSTMDSLFSGASSASTAPTTAPSSRRSSFATSSPRKPPASPLSVPLTLLHSSRSARTIRTTPTKPSSTNRFSVLEVFEAEE
ncbi:hypothetical protein C2E23DRAFT_881983 [Lenzites betulinus]|nr:hypothetical protein C2E23DRAFT_881983 [Lenzites betulinus]